MSDTAQTPRRAAVAGGGASLGPVIQAALESGGFEVIDFVDDTPGLNVLVLIARNIAFRFTKTEASTVAEELGGELRTAFLMLRRGVAAIRGQGAGGAVVFVAPPSDGHRSFDALRQGLRLLTKSAALELGPEGIRVNIVLPGSGETPLGRACTDADIAAGVAFAASDRAHFMTGADLVIDGGTMVQ